MPTLAVRLASVLSSRPLSAQDVLDQRDRLKVIRVHAVRHATEMVKRHPIGDRSDHLPVGDAVGVVLTVR